MKQQFLNLAFILAISVAFGQTTVDSIVNKGIEFHDTGDYQSAIETYKKALEIEPNSSLVHTELAMTYMYNQDYENAIKHSDLVFEQNGDHLLPAYITKASSLDYLGKPDEAISLFQEGIEKFGDHFLLLYNLAYTYYEQEEYEKAIPILKRGIASNPDHSSSHFLLGEIMSLLNRNAESVLNLHYFLFLEPNTDRSVTAFNMLLNKYGANVSQDEEKENQINISLDPEQSSGEFGPANMMLSMLGATNMIEKKEGKSEMELFISNTESVFKILGELKDDNENSGLYWDFYIPFFHDLAKSEHLETYCYYISLSVNDKSPEWLNENSEKTEAFGDWLQGLNTENQETQN
ncbi:tetratricopeptide repeat protein [Salegentibacter chungangensis]|uniref:Tetratricopeptide repeat protein n=1 Tax=Salegentibacter chungangensis TaxID=1335724 RepID=A0ABW3NQT7_9FLAO